MTDDRDYCCTRNGTEAMAGTADVVDVWLMLEYRPAWKAKALAQSDLSAATRRWLDDAVAVMDRLGLRSRVQLVRRPELDDPDTRLFFGLHDELYEYSGTGYDFLQVLDPAELVLSPPPEAWRREPHYFVCTNGQRDLCCARFGLPVYRELRQRFDNRVWQATHLGGHRFAPNVLVLPGGLLYGRVTLADLDGFARCCEAGEVAFDHLRGRSRYPQHVQAAEALLRRDRLRLLHVAGDDGAAQVTFADGGGAFRCRVRRRREPLLVPKSCGEDAKPVHPFEVVEGAPPREP